MEYIKKMLTINIIVSEKGKMYLQEKSIQNEVIDIKNII